MTQNRTRNTLGIQQTRDMMGDSVDDLLAQIKAQYADAKPSDAPPQPQAEPSLQSDATSSDVSPPLNPTSNQSQGKTSTNSIDDLLAEIEGNPAPRHRSQHQSRPSPPLPTTPSVDWQQVESESTAAIPGIPQPKSSTDHLLNELKVQYQECDRAEELKQQEQRRAEEQQRQEQLRQEQQRQAELKRQKQLASRQQAEEWLKRLDPRSGEAAWFEEFAAKYESRLEAAIDYLGLDEEGNR